MRGTDIKVQRPILKLRGMVFSTPSSKEEREAYLTHEILVEFVMQNAILLSGVSGVILPKPASRRRNKNDIKISNFELSDDDMAETLLLDECRCLSLDARHKQQVQVP